MRFRVVLSMHSESGVAVQDFPEMLPGSVFHDTASAVTRLYADAGDVCSHGIDLGIDYGYQKRNRELLNWLKKKKKCLKREDLVAFLCGVPYSPPPEHPVTHVGVVAEPSNMPSFLDLGRHPFHSHASHDTPSIGPPLSRLSVNDPPPLRPLPLLAAPPPVHLPVVVPRKRTVLKLGDTQRFFEDVCIEQTRKRASLPFQDEEEELFSAKRGKTCCD